MNIRFIIHKDITENELLNVIKIKSKVWPYSLDNQLIWIKENIKDDDIHVLLSDENNIFKAYLNLIEIVLEFNKELISGFGIGNVCALEKGKGWGKKLMKLTNSYLEINKKMGLLFCKSNLIKFYTDSNWELVPKKKIKISYYNETYVMVFN
ncbi:hypothetical protein, partial [Flavobacterium sp.]|uniref:hypothetical protein n=1 Tax=Flavobacterium sp. TaxID=239 RepID=UPI0040488F72